MVTGGAHIRSSWMGRSHHIFEQLLHGSLGSSQEKENSKANYNSNILMAMEMAMAMAMALVTISRLGTLNTQ